MEFLTAVAILACQDAGRIVFEQGERVWSVKADGSDRKELERKPSSHGELSPDGKRRVAMIMGCGSMGLTISDPDGKNAIEVEHDGAVYPHWSPDGKQIVFTAWDDKASRVWIVDADGKGERALTDGDASAMDAAFTPDGHVAFLRRGPSTEKLPKSTLTVMDADGKNALSLVADAQIVGFAWDPSGRHVAYSIPGELWVYNEADKAATRIVEFPGIHKDLYCHGAFDIVWSPDGASLACAIRFLGGRMVGTKIAGDDDLFVVKLDGTAKRFEAGEGSRVVRWEK